MKRQQKGGTFHPEDFPVLQELLGAYLHEDFAEEYGSALEAVKGLLSEASGDEILGLKEEWQRFRKIMSALSLKEIQAALARLGVAWRPEKEEELQAVDEILSRTEA